MTAISDDISILNTPHGFEILPPYQAIYNGLVEGWEPALVKTLLVVYVYDCEFPREDVERITRTLRSMLLKLALDGEIEASIRDALVDPTYSKFRGILLMMDPRDIFALGW